MKYTLVKLLMIVSLVMSCVTPALAEQYKAQSVSIDIPPSSLEQWYKPANKRQVWLHTMFRLRREMQAISEYSRLDDEATMEKWLERLDKDYNKIVEMVPEWKKEIKPRLVDELRLFAKKDDKYRLQKTMEMIERTCDDCHTQYAPLVTAMYRSPYYENIKSKAIDGSEQSFEENMEDLSASVNRILIALDDGNNLRALYVSRTLRTQLQNLGESCDTCHKDDAYPKERILGEANSERFETLQSHISAGRVKDSQKMMGEIAVTVCARCHNTHRIVYDLRDALMVDE